MKKKVVNNSSGKSAGRKIFDRISRIEGQLKGVRRMLEGEKDCINVISQVLAIREAVGALGVEIMKDDFICRRDQRKIIDESYLKTLFKVK